MKQIVAKFTRSPLATAALLGILALSPVSLAGPASAEPRACGAHDKIVKKLGSRFKEKRQAFGLINSSRMMEVFVSQSGSWTIVVTTPDKISCIVATGESWEQWKVKFGPDA